MKVNMTPNPLDVVTIHASQGDTEARQWEFELHNNGELIDTSDVNEQLVFKAYKGGTEQILPENGAVPVTAPFIGDIKYPDVTRTDQEFLYRESPTEEDGLAKITDIKGNTLVWNQQVDISVVPSSSVINGITYDRQTSEIKATGTASADSTLFISGSNYNIYNFINGHSYYLKGCPSGGLLSTYYMSWSLPGNDYGNGRIAKATSNLTGYIYARIISGVTVNNLSFKPQLFDLTSMGIDDLTTPTQVEEWLSNNIGLLPYYSYNQGTLLSFMGNGIKTVSEDETEESTLSLPISTYFSNGMKSAGNVYDELTESKAITRIGSVDLGSLTWSYRESGTSLAPYFYATFMGVKYVNPNVGIANVLCAKYQTVRRTTSTFIDKTICMDGDSTRLTQIQIKDSSYTDATALKNSLQGQYLYYEMVTETESSFTTASLVTENAEIPLSNEDGILIGKCTEQLSENPGFIDAKIKLSDADGECYSNKIQLHVERSPQ